MLQPRKWILLLLVLLLLSVGVYAAYAWTGVPVVDDPLVRMPGTQPGQVSLETPNRCLNCHAGYNTETEPGFNWKGSMMAQAARDFLFWSCMTVAAQDSIWAAGRPNATDICERCHFPKGWLEGRSDPTNASLMTGADYDGVQCDFCHRMYDPFFVDTHNGTREGNDWLNYWDETNVSGTPSQPAADDTYAEDLALAENIMMFNGTPFFSDNHPPVGFDENGSGQFFVSPNSQKRASFADTAARHQTFYSRYHKSKYFCSTCHDVSNPVLANLGSDPNNPLPTESDPAYSYFHVERTFSEFMLSDYGQQGGAGTNPEFQAQGAPNITHAAKCQDCHMRDVTGVGANKKGAPIRPDESVEHPNSGQPLHDMTGGNAWVPYVLASAIPGSPNYDPVNDGLLNQGPAVLTVDLSLGEGIDPVALLAGVDRAKQQLLLAATIKGLTYDSTTGVLSFQIQNNTGHKLISGFPEGRRMFVNVKTKDAAGNIIYEINPYDANAGTLKGLDYPYLGQGLPNPQPLGVNEVYVDELVFEMHPESALTGESESFHVALATGRHKDNRIPPKGFDIANAASRLSRPVYYVGGVDIGADYFTQAEYDGGFDSVTLTVPAGADYVEVNVYYQTTSREYIEFLRDEINGIGNLTLGSPTPSGESEAYVVQTDDFFLQLREWGNTLWDLWTHNMNIDGAMPFLMTQAMVGEVVGDCTAPTTTLLTATPGNGQVSLTWQEIPDDPNIAGYRLYYDQAGKAQFVSDIAAPPYDTFTDSGLTNGQEYCYEVTTYYSQTCESSYSNILCATPTNQGQSGPNVGVFEMETGVYIGKGKSKTFELQTVFNAGDTVVIRARVVDEQNLPVSNATVEIVIGGMETTTLNSNPSDADGWAEANWQSQKPNRKGQGGTAPGQYTATTINVTASGYNWNSVTTSASFTVN